MSFSQRFTFHVSGSVKGPEGPIGYSDSVDVTVNVDTSAFDDSVRRCEHQVCRLRNSVVETARQIVVEKGRSAKKIATAVVGGFFKYIRYEIGDKMMRLNTRIPMLLQSLKGMAGHCLATRSQLEKDYQNITSRYTKIFDDLQVSLYTSLIRLDRPVFELSKMVDEFVLNSVLHLTTTEVVLTGQEQSSSVNVLEVAQIKNATQKVVSECARNIMYNIRLERQIEHMMQKGVIANEHHVCMPIVQIKSDQLESESAVCGYVFSGAFPSIKAAGLLGMVTTKVHEGFMFKNVLDSPEAMSAVDQFFRVRLSKDTSVLDEPIFAKRFCSEVMRMWEGCIHDVKSLSDKIKLHSEKED